METLHALYVPFKERLVKVHMLRVYSYLYHSQLTVPEHYRSNVVQMLNQDIWLTLKQNRENPSLVL